MDCLNWNIVHIFLFLKGDAVGDKPLEVHAASNKEQTQK